MPAEAQKNGKYMEVSPEDIGLFDRMLDGSLSATEQKRLQVRLDKDSALQEAYEQHYVLRRAVDGEGHDILKAKFAALTADITEADLQSYTASRRGGASFLSFSIWALVLIFGGYFAFDYLSNLPLDHQPTESNPSGYELPYENAAEKPRAPKTPVKQEIQVIRDTIRRVIHVSGTPEEQAAAIQEAKDKLLEQTGANEIKFEDKRD